MSALSRKNFRVELADGTVFDVQSVNADQLSYEDTRPRRKWPMITEGGIQRWHTFLAWSAARRAGSYTEPFEKFADDAVDVECTDEDEVAGEPVDPTLPAPRGS
jgi:hypothetical protein